MCGSELLISIRAMFTALKMYSFENVQFTEVVPKEVHARRCIAHYTDIQYNSKYVLPIAFFATTSKAVRGDQTMGLLTRGIFMYSTLKWCYPF